MTIGISLRCRLPGPIGRRLAIIARAVVTFAAIDRKEYDLVLTIRAEAVAQKRLQYLDDWTKQYPQSELAQVRRELYLRAFQELGDNGKMLLVAEDMVREQPDSFVGVYWCSLLLPASKETSADRLKTGDAAARQLLKGLDTYFAPDKKPESTAPADWQKQKDEVERMAHRALGWIEWQRGNHEAAEKEFTACLQKNPKDAEISAWYGTVLTLEKKEEKLPLAFWHLARAASIKDEGGLPEGQRRAVNNLLQGLYTSYHGNSDGLEKLLADSADRARSAGRLQHRIRRRHRPAQSRPGVREGRAGALLLEETARAPRKRRRETLTSPIL